MPTAMLRHAASKSPFRSGSANNLNAASNGDGQGASGSGNGGGGGGFDSALSSLVGAGFFSSASGSFSGGAGGGAALAPSASTGGLAAGSHSGSSSGGHPGALFDHPYAPAPVPIVTHNASPSAMVHLGMHGAAATGNVGLIKYAFDHGQSVESVLNGIVPLHAASSGGSEAAARQLLSYGADPNAPRLRVGGSGSGGNGGSGGGGSGDSSSGSSSFAGLGTEGSTPLHFAAANGHEGVVRILLDAGAQPDVKDRDGNTPEMLALAGHHDECVVMLRGAIAGPSSAATQQRPGRAMHAQQQSSGSVTSASRGRRDSSPASQHHHTHTPGHAAGASSGGGSTSSISLRTQRSLDQISSAAAGVKQSFFGRKSSSSGASGSGSSTPNAKGSGAQGAAEIIPPVPPIRYPVGTSGAADAAFLRSASPSQSISSDTSPAGFGATGAGSVSSASQSGKRRPSLPSIFERAAQQDRRHGHGAGGGSTSSTSTSASGSAFAHAHVHALRSSHSAQSSMSSAAAAHRAGGAGASAGPDLIEELSSEEYGFGSAAGTRMAGSASGHSADGSDGQGRARMGSKRSIGQLLRKASASPLFAPMPARLPAAQSNDANANKPSSAPYSQTAFDLSKPPVPAAPGSNDEARGSFDSGSRGHAAPRLVAPSSSSSSASSSLQHHAAAAPTGRPRQGSASTASPSIGMPVEGALTPAELGALLRRRALSSSSADRNPFGLSQFDASGLGLRVQRQPSSNRSSPLMQSTPLPKATSTITAARKNSAGSSSAASVSSAPAPLYAIVNDPSPGAHGSPHFSPRTRAQPLASGDDARSVSSSGVRQARSNSAAGSSAASISVSNKASSASLRSMGAAAVTGTSAAEQAQAIMRNAEETGSTLLVKDGQKISLAEQLAALGEALARERGQQPLQHSTPTKGPDGPQAKTMVRALTSSQSSLLPSVSEDGGRSGASSAGFSAPSSKGSVNRPRALSNDKSPNPHDGPHASMARSTSAADSIGRPGRSPRNGLKELFLDPSTRTSDYRVHPEGTLGSRTASSGNLNGSVSRRGPSDYRHLPDFTFDAPSSSSSSSAGGGASLQQQQQQAVPRASQSSPVLSRGRASEELPRWTSSTRSMSSAAGGESESATPVLHVYANANAHTHTSANTSTTNASTPHQLSTPTFDSPSRGSHRYSDSMPLDMGSYGRARAQREREQQQHRPGLLFGTAGRHNGLGLSGGGGGSPASSRDDLLGTAGYAHTGLGAGSGVSPRLPGAASMAGTGAMGVGAMSAGPFDSFVSAVEASLPEHTGSIGGSSSLSAGANVGIWGNSSSSGNANASDSIGAKTKRKIVRTLFGGKKEQQQ